MTSNVKTHIHVNGGVYALVPLELARKVNETLHDYWFSSDDDGNSYNNDEVIEVSKEFEPYAEYP